MNALQRSLLTAATAWATVFLPYYFEKLFLRSLLWDLAYYLPPVAIGPFLALLGFLWVAFAAWVVFKIWR